MYVPLLYKKHAQHLTIVDSDTNMCTINFKAYHGFLFHHSISIRHALIVLKLKRYPEYLHLAGVRSLLGIFPVLAQEGLKGNFFELSFELQLQLCHHVVICVI